MNEIYEQIARIEEDQLRVLTPRALREILLDLYVSQGKNPETHPAMRVLNEVERKVTPLRKLAAG